MTATAPGDSRAKVSTRDRLLSVSADLFATQGFDQVSVRDLASRLGMTTGALYMNFRSKADLLVEVFSERVDETHAGDPDPDAGLADTWGRWFAGIGQRRELRALAIESAVAGRSDPLLTAPVREVHERWLDRWTAGASHRPRSLSPTDLDGLLRTAWALELGVGILEAYEALDVEPAALAHQAERLWSAANHPIDAPPSTSADPTRSEWIAAPWADQAAEKVDTVGTSARLLSSAAQLFDERGFSAVSVRDLARATGLTTGSIYGNFPNKLAVLVSVIEARIVQDLEQIPADVQAESTPADLVHLHLANMEERRVLRSLVLQGATAARSHRDARQRLRETQLRHTRFWADAFEAWAAARSIDFDGRGYVAAVWSAELGQGVLEAVGLTPPPASFMSSLFARVLVGVGLGPDHHAPIGPESRGASLP